MQPAEGTVVAERFRLERRLGQGGMGAVWLARHLSLDVPCALKFLHPEGAGSADIRARFEQEAKAAAQLRSPNVVQILDHGVWEDMPFIAMELLEGEDLDARLRRVGRLEPREIAVIVGQVARALGKAHAAGLVHRDLKPANIFLVRDEDREIAKVLDFGIAKRTRLDVGDAHTRTGSILGSPHFMSPEQARGQRDVDHRTDLWALGVIAFRCVVGRLPFQSESLGDLFAKIISDPIPVPSQLAGPAGVPSSFDAWWARASARDPAQRFQSAKDLADALTLALGVSVGSVSAPDLYAVSAAPSSPPAAAATAPNPATPGSGSSPGAHGTLVLTPGHTPAPGWSPQTAGAVASEVPGTGPTKRARSWVVPVAAVVAGALALGGASFVALRRGSDGSAPATTTATATATAEAVPAPSPPSAGAASTAPPAVAPAAPAPIAPSASASLPVVQPASPRAAPPAPQTARPPAAPPPRAKQKPVHDDGV